MTNIDIVAGDLEIGNWVTKESDILHRDLFSSKPKGDIVIKLKNSGRDSEELNLKNSTESVTILTEESKKRILGSAGWGVAAYVVGGLIAAPVAIAAGIAGLLKGGNRKEITFTCYLKDGRKFMGVTDSATFTKLQSYCFK